MRILAREKNGVAPADSVVLGIDGADFHGNLHEPVDDQIELRHVVRVREGGLDFIPVAVFPIEANVIGCLLV